MGVIRLAFSIFATAACFRKVNRRAGSAENDVSAVGETCDAQWNNRACAGSECYTCGQRISYLIDSQGYSSGAAKQQVANEFPQECGACTGNPTCESQWDNRACAGSDCYTCGDRITWLASNGHSSSAARQQVGAEFPQECGACAGGPGPAPTPPTPPGSSACLCVFDIDRTLTGKQSDTSNCPGNRELSYWDAGYGGGRATLSPLANRGINSTFCNDCYLGICSAGAGSGASSEWNRYLLDHVMRSRLQDQHPEWKQWSYGTNVNSPWVLNQGNRVKQVSVELIRQWYGRQGVHVEPGQLFFYGDRTENIRPFAEHGLNSREISCGSRDRSLYGGSGIVGYCGATPEEIQNTPGNILCR